MVRYMDKMIVALNETPTTTLIVGAGDKAVQANALAPVDDSDALAYAWFVTSSREHVVAVVEPWHCHRQGRCGTRPITLGVYAAAAQAVRAVAALVLTTASEGGRSWTTATDALAGIGVES